MHVMHRYCYHEAERNFVTWFTLLNIQALRLINYTDLGSERVKALQRRVGISKSDAPPDFQIRMQRKGTNEDDPLCWIDVKCPDKGVGDLYNLNRHKYETYVKVARSDRCPLYLVFYGQVRCCHSDVVEVHSTDEIIGWAELKYTDPRFSNGRIKVEKEKDTPFIWEINKLMAKTIRPS